MREAERGELVGSINLVRWLPCMADPSKIIVIGETDATIDVVMPLLNAILPNVISYYPLAGVMSLRRRPGLITLYPRRVQITQVDDVDDGLRMLAAVRDLLNQTWARRDQIEPKTVDAADSAAARRVRTAARAPTVALAARRPAWRSRSDYSRAGSTLPNARG